MALLKHAWPELFFLGLVQCSQKISLSTILSSIVNHLHISVTLEKISASRVKQVSPQKYQDFSLQFFPLLIVTSFHCSLSLSLPLSHISFQLSIVSKCYCCFIYRRPNHANCEMRKSQKNLRLFHVQLRNITKIPQKSTW